MATDTRTQLNPGQGGAQMDETAITQADGLTTAVRARVDVGFASGDERGRLVDASFPLPVHSATQLELLAEILDELKAIHLLLQEEIE